MKKCLIIWRGTWGDYCGKKRKTFKAVLSVFNILCIDSFNTIDWFICFCKGLSLSGIGGRDSEKQQQ